MIYVDTSVVLAQLLAEDRIPRTEFWKEVLVSSRLLVYEAWNRVNARGLRESHGDTLQSLVSRIGFVEMSRTVLERAVLPVPAPVRTLDGLHLTTADFLRRQGQAVEVATYDSRMALVAAAMGFPLTPL